MAGVTISSFAQTTNIGGIINQYGRVDSIGTDYVIVNEPVQWANFEPGNYVLLIQMKGARMSVWENSTFGVIGMPLGEPGQHEFLVVESVESATKKITFTADLYTAFDKGSYVQLIKVPYYNNALVTAKLECAPWDSTSGTGGVLAAIVGNTLSLNENIDVTGKGFKGGVESTGKGICIADNEAKWSKYAYSSLSDSAGYKGEGLAILGDNGNLPYVRLYPEFAKGKGANSSGGGGGNGKHSGGGGGANYGTGGRGGYEMDVCEKNTGGLPGKAIPLNGLFLGGGGGASTYSTGVATDGGNGGGIIILICDTLKGNGYSILADGGTPLGTAGGTAGAGGGGGGGSVAIYLQSFSTKTASSAITIKASGGKGGDNLGQTFGEGGGGGGGLITTNSISPVPPNVNKTTPSGGAPGTKSGVLPGAQVGLNGLLETTFKPVLNGFLFNSIRSSATGSEVDSICSNAIPKPIIGTNPIGTGPFTYLWQKSYNLAGSESVIDGETSKDLTFSEPETNTFWVRRVVTDNGATPDAIVDTSKWVNIIVQPAITGNLIGKDTTICYNQNPLAMTGTGTPSGGYGKINYHWLQNNDNNWSSYVNADGADSTKADFDPSALTRTTYYKRKVTSGHCVDLSLSTVIISVLPSITGNTLSPDTTICYNQNPLALTGIGTLSGGDGTFTYQWQDSTSGIWSPPVTGSNISETYSPQVLTETTWYRRIVNSSVCSDTSNKVTITVLPLISNNIITPVKPAVCFNTVPGQIMGSALSGGGGGTAIWTWEKSDDGSTWDFATGTNNQQNYSPQNSQTAKIWYRRIIMSGLNNCCIDTSSAITIDIDPLPTGTISNVSDTTICNGSQVQLKVHLEGAAGWTVVYLENTTQLTVNNTGTSDVLINRIPIANASLSTFNYSLLSVEDNNGCLATSLTGVKKADVYRIPDANAGTDGEICGPEYTFAALRSDGTGTWSWEPATPVLAPYPAGYNGKVIIDSSFTSAKVAYKFYWEEKNWLCADKDSVTVTFYKRIDKIIAGADTAIFTFDFRTKLNANPLKYYETGLWSVVSGKGDFESNNVNSTVVKNMAEGLNTYKWVVTNNGFCTVEDLLNIDVASALIPEGISPDGDLINDELIIKGFDPDEHIADLTIVNGAGSQVFKTSNRDGKNNWSNWDGKNSKGMELPEGTYYYLLKVESPGTDRVVQKSGFIILKRH